MKLLNSLIAKFQKPIVQTSGSRRIPRDSPEAQQFFHALRERRKWLEARRKKTWLERLLGAFSRK